MSYAAMQSSHDEAVLGKHKFLDRGLVVPPRLKGPPHGKRI
jgi:hypothetical protein